MYYFTNREKEFISLQSVCVGPRMIHRHLTLKSWTLSMYTEVMFISGDVLPLWDALFFFQRAGSSVPTRQAVSLGVAPLRTQQSMDWFWGDKAKKGAVKLQSPSSNGGLMPFLSLRSSRAGHQAPCCPSAPEADGTSAVHASHPNTPDGWYQVLHYFYNATCRKWRTF